MKRWIVSVLLLALGLSNVVRADVSTVDAFNQGATFWGSSPYHKPEVNSAAAAAHLPSDAPHGVPYVGGGNDPSILYGGGTGDLTTPSYSHNATCMSMTSNPDTREQMACDAVKSLNDSTKGGFVFSKSDPLFAVAKSAQSNPSAILGSAGMTFSITETACEGNPTAIADGSCGGPPCTTNTIDFPPESSTHGCTESMEPQAATCSLVREVEVDKDALYECTSSNTKAELYGCKKTLTVAVEVNTELNCAPGTWIPVGNLYLGGAAVVFQVFYYCEPNPTATHIKLWFDPSVGLHGTCQNGYAQVPKAPFVVSSNESPQATNWSCDSEGYCSGQSINNAISHAIHHWKGACTVGHAITYMAGAQQGCSGTTCSYSFKIFEIGSGSTSAPSGNYHDTEVLKVDYYWPRWGNQSSETVSGLDPTGGTTTATTTDTWVDQCTVYASDSNCYTMTQVCVDGPSTKVINGEAVTRDCWEYQTTYQCLIDQVINNCDPLMDAGCWMHTVPQCINTATNGTCLEWRNVFRCSDELFPVPDQVVFLDSYFTIGKDEIDNQCVATENDPLCTYDSETCVEPGGTRIINGMPVTKDCWKWDRNYTCGKFDNSQCKELIDDPECTLVSETCVETFADTDTCIVWNKQFTCVESGTGTSKTVTSCEDKMTCINGYCFQSGGAADQDFVEGVVWLEIGRQAGAYQDPDDLQLFKGVASNCRERSWGSCCKVKEAGETTNSSQYGMSSFGTSLTGMAARNVTGFIGSPYMFDALFQSDLLSDGAFNFIYGTGIIGGNAWSPTFSVWGLQVTFAPAASGGYTMGFAFDPYSFAFAVAMYVIKEVLTCSMTQDEGVLALRRGANLCNYVGSYCSKKVLGWCYERKQSYCCYNSKLAKLINTQGRAQLGKTFGSAKSPDCSGFSPGELTGLDFSQMDLTEFIKDIQPKMLDQFGTQAVVADNVNCKTDSYFQPQCDTTWNKGVIYDAPTMKP
jgi:conjugal transfer mating pair stabilization protein TraN